MIVTRVWKDQPGAWFFLATKDRSGKWKDWPFKRSEFGRINQFLVEHADKDLYFCPHGFSKPRRLKRYVETPKLLWADLDESNPRDFATLTPSIAWESSPGRFAALWRLTDFMTEDLNRRLTYHLKADPGGWDVTQVLRVPGTLNYKYDSKPRVKLLWMDGPEYKFNEVQKQLPAERKTVEAVAARDIYRKYEKNFSGWIRRQLLHGKPKKGKRSEVLWKLTNEIVEAGCSRDEAFELLRVSPWNKFIKRPDGDEQLRREIDKATSQHLRVVNDEDPREELSDSIEEVEEEDEEPEYRFLSRSMAEVEPENIDWLWYPYLALGEVSILEGDPGLGKSYLAQMVSKCLVDGTPLPSVKRIKTRKGKVAYFDIENSAGSVTKKRLMENGCRNLHMFYQEEEPFTIDDDDTLENVYTAIERLKPLVVVFDTLNTYMGGVDTHNGAETQQTFKRFGDIARRFNCAVLVLRHLTKSSKGVSALYRGQGSITFSGFARVVMTVGVMPDDPDTRVMAVTKINVARPPKALTFQIEELPDTLKETDRSKFTFGEFVQLTSDQILSSPKQESETDRDKPTVDWLEACLAEGPTEIRQLLRMAEARSFSEKMVQKAAKILNVNKDGSVWSLSGKN